MHNNEQIQQCWALSLQISRYTYNLQETFEIPNIYCLLCLSPDDPIYLTTKDIISRLYVYQGHLKQLF